MNILKGKAMILALAGVLFIPTTDAIAAEEEGLFCTVNSAMKCVFQNSNYYSPCDPNEVEVNDELISLVAALRCGTFHEGS